MYDYVVKQAFINPIQFICVIYEYKNLRSLFNVILNYTWILHIALKLIEKGTLVYLRDERPEPNYGKYMSFDDCRGSIHVS